MDLQPLLIAGRSLEQVIRLRALVNIDRRAGRS